MPTDKAVAGLRRYPTEESDRKQLSVIGVLNELLNQDGDITVSTVSRSAGVSREFIYSHDHLIVAVRKAAERSKQQPLDKPPIRNFGSCVEGIPCRSVELAGPDPKTKETNRGTSG
jgi:hypothetical protein